MKFEKGWLWEVKDTLRELKYHKIENEGKEESWDVYDSSSEEFTQYFQAVLGNDAEGNALQNLEEYIDHHYPEGNLIGLEIFGPGRALFRGLNKGGRRFARTFGVVLQDIRTQAEWEEDEAAGHTIIEADAFSLEGIQKIQEVMSSYGMAHVLFERAARPVEDLQQEEFQRMFYLFLKRWESELTADNATLLLQLPPRDFEEDHKEKIGQRVIDLLASAPEVDMDYANNAFDSSQLDCFLDRMRIKKHGNIHLRELLKGI